MMRAWSSFLELFPSVHEHEDGRPAGSLTGEYYIDALMSRTPYLERGVAFIAYISGIYFHKLAVMELFYSDYARLSETDKDRFAFFTEILAAPRYNNPAGSAIERYRCALVMDAEFQGAEFNLAGALTLDGQLEEALKIYQKTSDRNSSFSGHSFLNAALIYHRQNKLDIAGDMFEKAIAVLGHLGPAHLTAAEVFHQNGKIELALQHFDIALDMASHPAPEFFNLGLDLPDGVDDWACHPDQAALFLGGIPTYQPVGSASSENPLSEKQLPDRAQSLLEAKGLDF